MGSFVQSRGATFIWNGAGANPNWSNGTNWIGGIAPTNNGTASIVLAGTNQLNPNVDATWDISSLAFSTNAGAFTLRGSALTVRAGGIFSSNANPQIISNAITLFAAQTWTAASNTLTFAGNINNASNLLTVSGSFNTTIKGVISGTGGITKTGTGTNFLSGTNTYSGLTTVSAGILNIQNSSALGSASAGTTVVSGAQLQLQGGITVAGETLSLNGTGISTSGAFRNISGSNSWSGLITLAAASTIDADAGTLNLIANITNAANTVTFTNVGTIILAGGLGGGTGGLSKIGTGTLILNGTNTFTGATTINNGVVQFGATGNLPAASAVTVNASGALDLNSFSESILSLTGAGSVTLGGGTLTVNNSAATTYSGVMSGMGRLVKAGAATFTLSGVNTFSGGTTINVGAISIAADTALGNATNSLTLNGGTLIASLGLTSARAITLGINGGIFNETANATLTLSGVISGPGALTKIGTRTLALTGTNTYLGGTTNAAGTLTVGSEAALGDSGGTLVFSNSTTFTTTASFSSTRNIIINAGAETFSCGTGFTNTFNGVISGVGALTQSGSGVMVLGGNNTFTNLLTISKGTVRLGGNERLADLVPVLIAATTATLDLNNFNETIGSLASSAAGSVKLGNGFLTAGGNNLSTTNSTVISGNGGFTKAGTGTLIFTGQNTYTNTTTVGAGTLQLGASERIANTSPLVVSNGAVFNLTNFNETVASLAGAGSVTLGSGTNIVGNTNNFTATFSGVISGVGAFIKINGNTQIFTGTNTYSGATTVSGGNLQVNGSSSGSAVSIASTATLSGNGTVGTVTVNSGATNSPGASAPGTLTSGSQTWAGGGNYIWEINNAAGAKGASWDWLNISGALTINATSASKFNIRLISLTPANATGSVTNFDNTVTYIWTIASASGGISGFDTAKFNLITAGFQNSLGAGSFILSQSGNDLNLIFTSAAPAAIKGVQSGTLTSTGNGTNTATLGTAVNPANAFLIFNTRHNSSVPGGSMIRGRIASSNSVEFVRATTETATMNIQWYVVEYSAGVRVQRGEVNQTNTVINVPLSPLSAVNQAFVTWSKTPDPGETTFSDSDPVAGEITATTNLQFRVSAAPSSTPVISWQVIEFQNPAGIGVQKGSVTNMTGTNKLATVTLPAPVNPDTTFLLAGYRTSGSGTSVGARMLRAQLTDASTVTFDRGISGAPDDISEIAWQAVQLNDGTVVQSGTATFSSGIAETNATIISLNTNRAVAFASVQPAGGQNTGRSPSTGNVLGVGSATLAMTSATQLTLDRNNTSDQVDVGWQMVGFGPGTLLTPATGGSAISADTTTNTYTGLTGPVYTEIQNGNVGAGTIILKTPAGFIFDTNAPLPTVLISRVDGSGGNGLNINGVASGTSVALTTVNTTNLTFTVTSVSSGGVQCSLMWQNLRVRPTAGTPLAIGNLVSSGTSIIQGVTTNSTSWGFLAEVAGADSKLAISNQPSATAVAGVEFARQPVVQIQDKFGNVCIADDSTAVTATSSGTDTNDVNGSVTVVDGVAVFSGMSYLVAQTNTITFGAPGLTSKTSSNIVVSAAAASQLTVVMQPSAAATAGIKFAPQPVVQVQDQFGNLRKTDNSTVVTVSIDQGSGNLFGTQTRTAVNGVVTFTNLSYQVAEIITLDFDTTGLDSDTSTGIAVGAAAASQLVIQTQPSANATAGVPFAQQPAILVEDQFGNVCATNNVTIVTASRNAGTGSGTLQGALTATASGGVATFANLSHNVATTISVDFNSGSLTNDTSDSILIAPADAAKLAFTTQPGSATVGSIFGVQPAVITQDAYGNNSVSGLANSLNVTLALTSGAGTLQGTTNVDIGTGAGNGSAGFTDLEIDSAGSKQLTASAGGLTSAVSSSFSVAQGSQIITFGSQPDKTYGDSSFTVSASASSGLPVTFSIVSGPASVSSSNVTITGAGTVTVRASQPGDTNYTAAVPVDQSFTVAKADSSLAVSTSANPSPTSSNVTFTTTVSSGAGTPTGTVQFLSDGASLGSPATLSGGIANVGTSSLSHGSHTITARYAGDVNFLGSTNNLSPDQVINSQAVAATDALQRHQNSGAKVRVATLLANDADADGDTVSFVSVDSTSANGGAVSLKGSWITYDQPVGFTNADSFNYVIADSGGLQATGAVSIAVIADTGPCKNTGSIEDLGNGSFKIHFDGIPGRTYTIQYAEDLPTPDWQSLGTATADVFGKFDFTDSPATNSPPRFYRSTNP